MRYNKQKRNLGLEITKRKLVNGKRNPDEPPGQFGAKIKFSPPMQVVQVVQTWRWTSSPRMMWIWRPV